VRLIPGDAEHRREIGAMQVMPEAKLEDLALTRSQPRQCGTDLPAQFGPVAVVTGVVERFIRAHLRRAQPAVTFVSGHGVKPGTQLARVTQTAEFARGDDERVLNGIGRVGEFVQHPIAVAVEGLRVSVVGIGKSGQVTRRDGRDNFAVVHDVTVVELAAYGRICAKTGRGRGSS